MTRPVTQGGVGLGTAARRDPVDTFAECCARLGPALIRDLALTDTQAAAILGNFGHETGGFRHLQEMAPTVPGSRGGWGIAQWTGPRRVAMEAWSRGRGLNPASEAANEGYLVHELAHGEASALAALKRTATLIEATEVFCRLFERPGILALPSRQAWARRALAAIRAGGTPAAFSAATPVRRPAGATAHRSPPARRRP